MEADSIPGSNSGANGAGYAPSPLSTDGRFVLFTSMSDNLVSDNDLNTTGLFRRDMQNGEIVLVSRLNGKNGAPIKGGFYDFKMDGSGNRVVFTTDQQLTGDDTDDQPDAYMRDIAAGTTTLVSPDTSLDVINPAISADGQYITFSTLSALVPGDLNGKYDVYRRKVSDGTVGIVSRIPAAATAGDSDSFSSGISGDGRWVAFSSRATNLVAGFVENNSAFATDVFVRDMVSGNTYLVSSRFNSSLEGANDGSEDPVIAGTPGTLNTVRVAFTSYSTNLADNGVSDSDTAASVYLKSFPSQASVLVSRASGATGENANSRAHTPSISDNASRIVFTSDAGNLGAGDNYYGTYLRNLTDNTTTLVSNDNSYAVWGQISGNGATASWDEAGGGTPDSDPDLGCVFRRTFSGDIVRLVSRPKGSKKVAAPGFASYSGHDSKRALSADGRYMVFATWSSHLPSSEIFQQQIYRRDLKTGKIEVVSRASGANGALAEVGFAPSISGNGNLVAFTAAGQLDPADTNDRSDIYVRNMSTGTTTLVSRADGPDGAVSDEGGHYPSISTDGTRVAYSSEASNMGAPGGHEIVYVRDLGSGTTSIASRATGLAGAIANQYSSDPMMNGDGSLVVFGSNATNLSPDDGASSNSIYLRNIDTGETLLVSRNPGLTGTSLPNYVYDGAINSDGTKVAFVTANDTAVPATAPWPAGQGQVVIRTIADGANSLGSSTPDGVVGNDRSDSPSFSGDGGI
ncbi:MAG TPA: hypothetical protein P5138_07085, partial [Solirubrobacterales bacterium]|nr:hypothetical protein [Solirubrobacterales bacterium]